MYLNPTTKSFKQIIGTALFAVALAAVGPALTHAATDDALTVSGRNLTVTAEFTLNTPCSGYAIDWGDGQEDLREVDEDMICIQVLKDMTLQHTYEKKGTYDITFTQGKAETTKEITLPVTVKSFALSDVEAVTALWVDPNPMMADEEYTIYTVTLKSGTVVKINAGGFTTQEWRTQQFRDAGYTGDIQALTEQATSENEPSPEEVDAAIKLEMQKEIIDLLKQIIALLKSR